ncbi:hypothetical protein F0562_024601 [Nyssa sinensis]|uniref:Polygalacturonase n=1 Tax=Nyssa sinensis TaxID=561372 RepID=A0A5J5BDR4_9ASTE|nr:hypothetical protein F0562_024601 [Nyssa sinensis]
MQVHLTIFLILCMASSGLSLSTNLIILSTSFNVMNYGAVGDGSTDDSQGAQCNVPAALSFNRCNGLRLSGLTHINSPRSHITITKSNGAIISNLRIIAPETSPNTDGIDISSSSQVQIRNCIIGTGDDCIAIGGGSSNINITGVTCGPGHGISIGALGQAGYDRVEEIHVRNCTFKGTMNGVRIKTWQGGNGYARKISFEKIKFIAAGNPIFIDQFYCPSQVNCQNKTSAIKLSDISYTGIIGTSTVDNVINLSCSQSVGCTNIVLDHVYITSTTPGNRVYANCFDAHGRASHTRPADYLTVFLILCMASSGLSTTTNLVSSTSSFDVMNYGAVGDGTTDDSQVSGNIVAPNEKSAWTGYHINRWLTFSNINGLIINGRGQIDGKGSAWWPQPCLENVQYDTICKGPTCKGPTALTFNRCNGLRLDGLTHINSPRSHIVLTNCNSSIISNLHIIAPETSPNTDGIDIYGSTNIQIRNCNIGTGDDCIAICGGSSNVDIAGVICGPGHGISIGALGHGGYDAVENIKVRNCTLRGTTNGVRIKSWQGGNGYARKISFEKINFIAASNPIIIDQFYCPPGVDCQNKTSAIKLSDISYTAISGTSTSDKVIDLSCSQSVGCTNIVLDHVYITPTVQGKRIYANCFNAHGRASHTKPAVKCLLQ